MTTTNHDILLGEAAELESIADASVQLVVTSPPYPMIEMWDECFAANDPEILDALAAGEGARAFELMHGQLDRVWAALHRVLAPGALVCINVGDATRKIGEEFRLWSNHARIVQAMNALGFSSLPDILWRKPTNAPNKFLGSGMLPAGAYVTYEHEYILIFRKGRGREFRSAAEKELRRRSAFFWEERNLWFSDVWTDLRGTGQALVAAETRARSGAFPFELAHRLVQMFSLQGDLVFDPFLGTGTTSAAALASGRESVGVEREAALLPVVRASLEAAVAIGQQRARQRLIDHQAFVAARQAAGKTLKHVNEVYGFPVITGQEKKLALVAPLALETVSENSLRATVAEVGIEVQESLAATEDESDR